MTEKEKVGISLRNLRTSNTDLGVSEVARKMNKSKDWLSQIETGKRKTYFDDVQELCSIYGCSLSDISDMIDKLYLKVRQKTL